MRKNIYYLIASILFLFGAGAVASFNEDIKSEIFVCGENVEGAMSFHLAVTDDNRLVSFAKYNGETFADQQLTYLPTKISMEKIDDTCFVTIVERVKDQPLIGNFKFESENGKIRKFTYTTDANPSFTVTSRQCRLMKEYEKTIGKCQFSKDSYMALQPTLEERFYNCGFKGPGTKVNAKEKNLIVKDPKDGTDACLYSLFCKLKSDSQLESKAKGKLLLPYYDSWMVCLPLNDKCKKSYAQCNHEVGLSMSSSDDSKIRETVGMSVHSAQ